MAIAFSEETIGRIEDVLGVPSSRDGSVVRFVLKDEPSGRKITLEIAFDLMLPGAIKEEQADTLVTVMAPCSLLQLQGCTGYIASKEMGEVIFFARRAGVTNGLVVEREAGCSLYANFDQRLLSTDYTQLSPELIMSAVALSLTETFFDDFDEAARQRLEPHTLRIEQGHSSLHIDETLVERLVHGVLEGENQQLGDLEITFAGDGQEQVLGEEYLSGSHGPGIRYLPLGEEGTGVARGKIFVNLDTALKLCSQYPAPFKQEACRYAVRGVLYLLGYNDADSKGRQAMRPLEDGYLKKYWNS